MPLAFHPFKALPSVTWSEISAAAHLRFAIEQCDVVLHRRRVRIVFLEVAVHHHREPVVRLARPCEARWTTREAVWRKTARLCRMDYYYLLLLLLLRGGGALADGAFRWSPKRKSCFGALPAT